MIPDNKQYYYDKLKQKSKNFNGIEKGFEFLDFFFSDIELAKKDFEYSENFIVYYNLKKEENIKIYTTTKNFNKYLNNLYFKFLVNSIFLKTEFSIQLILILKKMKIRKNFKKKIGSTKEFVKVFFYSLLESRDYNNNSFDEKLFCRFIHDRIFENISADYAFLFVESIIDKLKSEKVFFSLESNRISLQNNIIYMLINNLDIIFPFYVEFNINNISHLELINFFYVNKKLNDLIKNKIDLQQFYFIFNLIEAAEIKINYLEYESYYYDYYNIDLFNFNKKINKSKIVLFFFNKTICNKFDINITLFFTVISSCFDNYFFKKRFDFLNLNEKKK